MSLFMLVALISVSFFNVILGLFVYLKNRKKTINIIFFFISICISVWALTILISWSDWGAKHIDFWSNAAFWGPSFLPSFLLLFSLAFSEDEIKIKKLKKVVFLIFLLSFALLALALAQKINVKTINPWTIERGFGIKVFNIYFISFILLPFYFLFRTYKKSSGSVREQIYTIYIGFIAAIIVGCFFNLFLPLVLNNAKLTYLGPSAGGTMFVIVLAYAITKHRLLDINVIMRQYLVYAISIIAVTIPILISKYLIILYFPRSELILNYAILIFAIYIFPEVKNSLYSFANKYFFTSLYDTKEVIDDISLKLSATLRAKKVYYLIFEIFQKYIHAGRFGILIYNNKKQKYCYEYNYNFRFFNDFLKSLNREILQLILEKRAPFLLNDLKDQPEKYQNLIKVMAACEVQLIIPLQVKGKLLGIIALGEKEAKEAYNEKEMQIMEIISTQAAITIENTMRYEEAKLFRKKLEHEVRMATQNLVCANEKLKKLDTAKSEFISIASHQLRTPLTVIKGYMSMLLEGSFGKLCKRKLDPLEKCYESNERLINLVENLLNISRIESGRIQMSFTPVEIADIAEMIIDELHPHARRKNIKLSLKKPKQPLEKIMVDREKLRQALMNLVDNAIKYTRNGEVRIELKDIGDKIQICVIDTGTGIAPDLMPLLFKKFSHGFGPRTKYHTEGTGLGLFVTKQMVDMHKGKIWVESRTEGKDRGSRFCIQIPLIQHSI